MALPVLPVTAMALAPFTGLHLFLVVYTILGRVKTRTFIGGEGNVKPDPAKAKKFNFNTPIAEFDPLLVARAAHSNFLETVPLAMILSAVIEINGGDPTILGRTLAALFVSRAVHAFGLLRNNRGRQYGFFGNFFVMVGLAVWVGVQGYSTLS